MFVQNIGYTALLLGVLVFVHEFGHFIVAKAFNVKVLRFSIGFGPKIAGFTVGETEYRIAWLPLGGYVKMAGELPFEELPPEDAARGFLAQAPWKRGLIVSAGPVFNLIFPVAVFFGIFFFGLHETLSTRIGSVEPGLPAAEAGLKPGDRVLKVDEEPVRTFEELRNALVPHYASAVTLTVERDGKTFTTSMTPARTRDQNLLESSQRALIDISPFPRPPVAGVQAGSPAYAAGLRTFDRVLSVNGVPTRDVIALAAALQSAPGTLAVKVARPERLELPGVTAQSAAVVDLTVPKQPGEGLSALGAEPVDLYLSEVVPGSAAEKLGLKRGDRVLAADGKRATSFAALRLSLRDAGERAVKLEWMSGTETKSGELKQTRLDSEDENGLKISQVMAGFVGGVDTLPEAIEGERVRVRVGPIDAMRMSLKIVPDIIRQTAMVMGFIFTGKVPFETLGGPKMLYDIAKRSAEEGADSFLRSMALISINLGIINLLPIPVLDGFHLLAAVWEGVRRRPIPIRAREIANMIGLAMLFILMVMVLKNDFTR